MSAPPPAGRVSRRVFLGRSLGGAAAVALPAAAAGCAAGGVGGAGRYAGLRTADHLGEARVETEVSGATVFLEGPAIHPEGDVFFSNIPASRILRWDPRRRLLSVFRADSNRANGLLFDGQGRLLACEADRVTRTDLSTGRVEVLASRYQGHSLAPTNDLAIDGRGRIYFTSRPSTRGVPNPYVNAVYRIDPDLTLHQILREPQIQMPNGIDLSPDQRLLYLIESHPGEGMNRHIKEYDLAPDGTVSDRRILYDFHPGRSGDGLALDVEGNLYVAAGLHRTRGSAETLDTRPGIHVISPEGRLLAYSPTPTDTVTNCAFGGPERRTLYITSGSLLLSMPTRIPGQPVPGA